jgi:hypothetical protein
MERVLTFNMKEVNSKPIWIYCPFCDAKQTIYIFKVSGVNLYYKKCFYCKKKFCYKNGKVNKNGW